MLVGMRFWGVILLLLAATGWAQEFRATLTGRVLDPASAPIAGAAVRLTNVDTGENYNSKASERGDYTFALMRPGNYELRGEHRDLTSSRAAVSNWR